MGTWDSKTYFNFEVFKLIIKAIALILLVKYFAPQHQEPNNKAETIQKTVIINDTIHQTIEKLIQSTGHALAFLLFLLAVVLIIHALLQK